MTQSTALSILKLGYTTFLTGAAGAGKSYVLREYVKYLKEHGIKYAVTASTGIASTHVNGATIHSWSGIGIKDRLTSYDLDALEEKQNLHKRWNQTQVLIIDEISMLHANFIDMLDRVAKHMRRNETPFGGLQVVFCGDFYQLPPVVRNDSSLLEVFAFQSTAWKEAKPVCCYLTEQYRQDDDMLLAILNAVRSGDVEEMHYEALAATGTKKKSGDHIRLYTHNENVDAINEEEFNKLEGDTKAYHMVTRGKAQLVASLKNNCLADEVLRLKVGAKVICIKNSLDRSYVNGSMGKVSGFDKEGAPLVTLTNGKQVTIVADTWKIEEDGKVKAEISQLPVKLAWAITIHKSQGMTLDTAEIDLSRAFASGQGYVALSRLTSLRGLYLRGFSPSALMISEEVRQADKVFRARSEHAEQALQKYSSKDITRLQDEFIVKCDGSLTPLEVDDDDDIPVRVASHMVTKEMLKEGKTFQEIAEARKLTVDTLIGHVEKLVEMGEEVVLEHVLPPKKEFEKITAMFEKLDTKKLTPVFDGLHGKVPYHSIRVVRAYLRL